MLAALKILDVEITGRLIAALHPPKQIQTAKGGIMNFIKGKK
jgi:hypothetical protein